MERTVYVVREKHKDLGICFVGYEFVLVTDPLDAWKFANGDAAKKKMGEPEKNAYEIIPLHIEYELDEEYALVVEPYGEEDEDED